MLKKSTADLHRPDPEKATEATAHQLLLILDDVRSMHNVGSVFRTADSFGIAGIWLCGFTPRPPHRDIHKTALGATETVNWQHFEDATTAVKAAQAAGYVIIAAEQAFGSVPLQVYKWSGEKLAIVFGNEVTGVSEAVMQMVAGCVEIPQFGAKHSLNISVAAGWLFGR